MKSKVKSIIVLAIVVALIAFLTVTAFVGVGKNKKYSASDVSLGLDLAGGVSITYEAVKDDVTQEEMDDTIAKMQRRIADFSNEGVAYQEGNNRVTIDIPGATDADAILKALGKVGNIYFIYGNGNIEYNADEKGYVLSRPIEEIITGSDLILEGSDVSHAEAATITGDSGVGSKIIVNFSLTDEGTKKFATATTACVGQQIAIVYDGKVVSAPSVRVPITTGEGYIEGMESFDEAKRLASTIRIGAFPIELQELRSSVVSATLGAEAVKTSLLAAAIGFAIVIIFMLIIYRIPGLAASLALCLYAGVMVFLLNLFQVTLTLPGMAGIILSVGMAVDGNVIIFQRIKEEIAKGKTVQSALNIGFEKARSAIIDGNVTTLIAAVVLYIMGTGTIQGFAITLGLGIILSMLTALVVTKTILYALYELGFDDIKFYGMKKQREVKDIVGHGKLYVIISGALIGIGIVTMIVSKITTGDGLNYGLDFKGGTSITAPFTNYSSDENLNVKLESSVFKAVGKNAEIVKVTGSDSYIIKTEELTEDERNTLVEALGAEYGVDENACEISNISGTISGEMRSAAIKAVILSTIFMLLYIWFRFKDIRYGLSAVLCLLHDVLVVLMVYAVSRISVGNTFIACMLTLVGYSINATIIVFDRIRENVKEAKRNTTIEEIANKSVNETVIRSLHTSITTLIMILMLAIFGVNSIRGFAFPLMVGLICGTYSSVCIAATLWVFLKKRIAERKEEDYEKEMIRNANKKR